MTIKSVKAIIIKKNQYLLQLRDNKKNIFFPNYWGLFGGRLEDGEKYQNGIIREIKEETNLDVRIKQKILKVNYNMIGLAKGRNLNYYECLVENIKNIKLFEGRKFKFFSYRQIKRLKIIPMDYVAIYAHFNYTYSPNGKTR